MQILNLRQTPVWDVRPLGHLPDLRWLFLDRSHVADLAGLHRVFDRVEVRHYYLTERLHRLLGDRIRTPALWFDHHSQRLFPFLRRYYGMGLILARGPRATDPEGRDGRG